MQSRAQVKPRSRGSERRARRKQRFHDKYTPEERGAIIARAGASAENKRLRTALHERAEDLSRAAQAHARCFCTRALLLHCCVWCLSLCSCAPAF